VRESVGEKEIESDRERVRESVREKEMESDRVRERVCEREVLAGDACEEPEQLRRSILHTLSSEFGTHKTVTAGFWP